MKGAFLTLALVGILVSSCSKKTPTTGDGKSGRAAAAPVPVYVAQSVARDIPVEISAVGNVRAYSFVSIRSQVGGKIMKVNFEEGQEVHAGDLLFTIDPRPFQAALDQAVANMQRDQAQLINGRLAFERTSNLFAGKIAAQADYDAADATFQSAQSTVMADAASLTNAQLNLDYTSIRSPIEGRTGDIAVREGNVVKAPDDVLVSVTQIHPIYVAFAVPESSLPSIRAQTRQGSLVVTANPAGDTNSLARGLLTFIDNSVDTNTGTILLKATFTNSDAMLWPGQFVQTTLVLSNLVQATVVPTQAVQTGQDGEFLFVLKADQTVEARPVTAGVSYDGARVISKGLKPGETVVIDGQVKLTGGSAVSVKTAGGDSATNSVTKLE